MVHQLAEARETKLVRFAADDGPTTRRAYFIKPVARLPHQAADISPAPPSPECDRPTAGVLYRGWLSPPRRWAVWVEKMEQLHGGEWDAVGIRGAIKASTLRIRGQPDLMSLLVQRVWCVETNTFVFPWGEVTPTLEDMVVLGGLPLLGEPAVRPGPLPDDLAQLESKMEWDRRVLNSTASRKALHSGWLKLYLDWNGAGGDGQLEHVAFLSLWLSRFVFPGPRDNTIAPHVFPLAVRIATGTRLALAPAVLASLYRDLRLIKNHAAQDHGMGGRAVVWAPFQLLQMWFWERFPALKPGAGPRFLQPHEPWAARWHGLEASPPTPVRGRDFIWRPYAAGAESWVSPPFYPDVGRWVDGRFEGDEAVLSFSRCLALSMLVGFDCTEIYLPHRVAMQLGYDQDIPGALPPPNASSDLQYCFIYDKPLNKVRFYLPSKLAQPHYTTQYCRWRRNHHRISAPTANITSEEQVPGPPAEGVQQLPAPRHVPLQKETAKKSLQCSSSMHGMQGPAPEMPHPTAEVIRESETSTAVAGSTEVEALAIVLRDEEPLSIWVPPGQKRKAEEQMQHPGFICASAQQEAPSYLSATKKVRSSASSLASVMGSGHLSVGATSSNPLVIDDVDDDEGVTRAKTAGEGEAGASAQEMIREISTRLGKLAEEIAVLQEKLARLKGRHP